MPVHNYKIKVHKNLTNKCFVYIIVLSVYIRSFTTNNYTMRTRHQDLTPRQVQDRIANRLFMSIILAWAVMTLIFTMASNQIAEAGYEEEIAPKVVEHEVTPPTNTSIGQTRSYDNISFIVIHHTATRDDLTAEQMELSMRRTYINNRGGKIVPTHYIIDKRGNLQRVNAINIVVWATLNDIANQQGIHIELVGDFNIHHPTEDQYNTLNSLIAKIENEVQGRLLIKWHQDFQAKNCPWVNFDWSKVKNSRTLSVWDELYFTKITAYYTPQPSDTMFSHWTYEASKRVNGNGVNAMWWDYKPDHKYTHWACGRRWEFGTVFDIKGRGRVVCVDRGSAINNRSFDIRYGDGENALRNIQWWKIHPQQWKVTIVHLP